MKLSSLSIYDLNQAVIKGDISAYEIAIHTLKNIEKYNPIINVWTTITSQRMLKEAKKIDKQRQNGISISNLAGVPYAVKDLFDINGYTTLCGSILFKDRSPANKDAWVIKKLCESGALLSGKVNMDAYAYGFTTENTYNGTTHNPRDLTRIAGGSSGGSAAAVAAGIVPFAIGTDTNGSIRVPASLCGIFSLKPTFGRISRRGCHPFVPSLDHIGIFARSVEDLTQVYDTIQGLDKKDAFQINYPVMKVTSMLNEGLKGIRLAILGGFFSDWSSHEAHSVIKIVANTLDIKEEIILPDADIARSAAFIMTAAEAGNHYLDSLRKMSDKLEPNSRERLLAGAMLPSTWYIQAQRFRRYFQNKILKIFERFDVLIAPATPCCATKIGEKDIFINGKNLCIKSSLGILTQPISFLGLPVSTVPLRTNNGLPIGIQLISAPFKEETSLRVAWILQQLGLTIPQISLTDEKYSY